MWLTWLASDFNFGEPLLIHSTDSRPRSPRARMHFRIVLCGSLLCRQIVYAQISDDAVNERRADLESKWGHDVCTS